MRSVLLVVLFITAFQASANGTFSNNQFEINAPSGSDASKASQPLLMSLPPKNGFSPNVNVQVQVFPGTLKKLLNITKSQIKSFGWELVESSIEGSKLTLEYRGSLQGNHITGFKRQLSQKIRFT